MKGLEALENWYNTEHPKPVEYCFHYNIIKKELKVLQILKEKRVDLDLLEQYLDDHLEKDEDISKVEIEFACKDYNSVSIPERQLKLEEAIDVVEWLKGE